MLFSCRTVLSAEVCFTAGFPQLPPHIPRLPFGFGSRLCPYLCCFSVCLQSLWQLSTLGGFSTVSILLMVVSLHSPYPH